MKWINIYIYTHVDICYIPYACSRMRDDAFSTGEQHKSNFTRPKKQSLCVYTYAKICVNMYTCTFVYTHI